MLGVTLSKDARARAIQLPAWNEALGLPRPWDQQWSLRMQQVLAFESDLLEYDDLFEGSVVVERLVAELVAGATDGDRPRAGHGWRGRRRRERLHEVRSWSPSHAARRARIESGEEPVVGVNAFTTTEPNPLLADLDTAIAGRRPGGRGARPSPSLVAGAQTATPRAVGRGARRR